MPVIADNFDSCTDNAVTFFLPLLQSVAGYGQLVQLCLEALQVNTKVDMTFARGLRAILRQDPDVVMVGEIPIELVHTPGHTGDHICLHDPESQLMLAADHVLPSITPHIGGFCPDAVDHVVAFTCDRILQHFDDPQS